MDIKRRAVRYVLVFILLISFVFPIETRATSETLKDKFKEAFVFYIGSTKALVNNEFIGIDSSKPHLAPMLKYNRTVIPQSFIVEQFDGEISFNEKAAIGIITFHDTVIKYELLNDKKYLNKQEYKLDPASLYIIHGYIPIRFVGEALGMNVFFDRDLIVISDEEDLTNSISKKDVDVLIKMFQELDRYSIDDFVSDLKQNGVTVSYKREFLSEDFAQTIEEYDGKSTSYRRGESSLVQVLEVDDKEVSVAQYKDAIAVTLFAQTIDERGYKVGNGIYEWQETPHFFKKGNLLIYYLGEDIKFIDELESILGKPITTNKKLINEKALEFLP